MLDLNALSQVTSIVCHDNCADGVVSAMLLSDALPQAKVQFCQYGNQQLALEVQPSMLFCDFAPHESRAPAFIAAGALILDHHKSARDVVAAFGARGIFGDEIAEPGVSGAVLAYRHVWLPLAGIRDKQDAEVAFAEEIAALTGIRDTWQKQSPDWNTACELAESIKFFSQQSWLVRDPFAPQKRSWWTSRLSVGQRLVERRHETVVKALNGAYRFTSTGGTRCVLFPGVRLTSDASEAEGRGADLVVGFDYFAIEDGQAALGYSLRSNSSGFDCAAFCSAMGGGGHTKAAGFTVFFDPTLGVSDPFSLFQTRVAQYEAETGL